MTKIEELYLIETDSCIHFSIPKKFESTADIKGTPFVCIHDPNTQIHVILFYHDGICFLMLKHLVVEPIYFFS